MSKAFPLVGINTFLVTSSPWYIMFFSSLVRSLNGISVLTPSSLATMCMDDNPNIVHGFTAPSSSVRVSSGTSFVMSTSLVMPVPEHSGHAPSLLNEYSSADNP